MQVPDEHPILSVTTTVSSTAEANALAREILDQRLAACVQIDADVRSLYRWQGELRDDPEVRLVIKSVPGCEAALQALFARCHPYEVPQFLTQRMSASAAYAAWAAAQTVVSAG